MEDIALKICRFCLKVICKNEYEIVEEKLVMVKTIFLDLNWSVSENPVICFECSENLQKSYNFKSTCLNTEEHIKSFAQDQKDEVDLWQIRKESVADDSQEENKICRFCLNLNKNDLCTNLEEKEEIFLMLQKCLSEVDLFLVCEPVICQNCFEALEGLFSFVTSCLDVEKSINTYCEAEGTNSNCKVDLYKVFQYTKIKKEKDFGDDAYMNEFVEGNDFGKVFVKSENSIKTEDMELDAEVFIKTEPCNFEEQEENSVKNEGDEASKSQMSRSQKNRNKYRNTFTCSQCAFTTKYKRNLRLHIMVLHVKPHTECVTCNECSYRTFYPSRLTAHVRLHTQDFPYACDVCQEKFNHRRYLDSHIVTKHPDSQQVIMTKVHKCDSCDFKTVYAIFLRRHVMVVHDNKDVKVFKCDKCAYSTDKNSDLRRHVLTHTDTKPFVCPACARGFTTKTHLDSHILNRHSDKENAMKLISSKIHYCTLCDYKAVNPTNLRSHTKNRHRK